MAEKVHQMPPTEAEIIAHMEKLKNQNCMGVDAVKMESIKYATGSALLMKYLLLTMIWTTVSIPAIWTISTIVCLFKKGSGALAANYRGISITATLFQQ